MKLIDSFNISHLVKRTYNRLMKTMNKQKLRAKRMDSLLRGTIENGREFIKKAIVDML